MEKRNNGIMKDVRVMDELDLFLEVFSPNIDNSRIEGFSEHLNNYHRYKMEKILKDRLNELKSKLANLINPKLDKVIDGEKGRELAIRIDEVRWMLAKLERTSTKIKVTAPISVNHTHNVNWTLDDDII